MLAAEKKQLQGILAQDIVKIRERELQFYADSLQSIATVAALLSTISLAMFNDMWNWPLFGEDLTPSIEHIPELIEQLQHMNLIGYLSQLLLLSQSLLVLITLVTNLTLLQNCIITNIAGVGLALRGPDGSVHRSLKHMRRELRRASRLLHRGLTSLSLSIANTFLNLFPFYIGIPSILVGAVLYRHSQQRYETLLLIFAVADQESEEATNEQSDFVHSGDPHHHHHHHHDKKPGLLVRMINSCQTFSPLSAMKRGLLWLLDRAAECCYGVEEYDYSPANAEESSNMNYGALIHGNHGKNYSFGSQAHGKSPHKSPSGNPQKRKATDEADRLIRYHQERIAHLHDVQRRTERGQLSENESVRLIQRAARRSYLRRAGMTDAGIQDDVKTLMHAFETPTRPSSVLDDSSSPRVRFGDSANDGASDTAVDAQAASMNALEDGRGALGSIAPSPAQPAIAFNVQALAPPLERCLQSVVTPAVRSSQDIVLRPIERCLHSFLGNLSRDLHI